MAMQVLQGLPENKGLGTFFGNFVGGALLSKVVYISDTPIALLVFSYKMLCRKQTKFKMCWREVHKRECFERVMNVFKSDT